MNWVRFGSLAYAIALPVAFLAVAIWESARPLQRTASPTGRRWSNHVLLYALSAACSWAIVRTTPVVVALAVDHASWGVLNRAFLPFWVRFAITLAVLDLVLYASHRLMHSVYFLWRIHEVHHADSDFDVSTAGRFHPIEVLITQGMYLGAIALLAPPVQAVVTWQILLVFENMFVHANQALPSSVERAVRWLVITPDLHRIHHSVEFVEQNHNFGEIFSYWDRLFGTYCPAAACHPLPVTTGLPEWAGTDTLALSWMAAAPFQRRARRVTTASTNPAPAQPPQ